MIYCCKCWKEIPPDQYLTLEKEDRLQDALETHDKLFYPGECCYPSEDVSRVVIFNELGNSPHLKKVLSNLMEAGAQLLSRYQEDGRWGDVGRLAADIRDASILREFMD